MCHVYPVKRESNKTSELLHRDKINNNVTARRVVWIIDMLQDTQTHLVTYFFLRKRAEENNSS